MESCYLWAFLLQQLLTFAPPDGCVGITRVTTLQMIPSQAGSHGKTLDRHVRESVEETLSAFTVLQRTTL